MYFFRYLYLTPEAYSRLGPLGSVKTQLIDDEGEARYKITDIIGIYLYYITTNNYYQNNIEVNTHEDYKLAFACDCVCCTYSTGAWLYDTRLTNLYKL